MRCNISYFICIHFQYNKIKKGQYQIWPWHQPTEIKSEYLYINMYLNKIVCMPCVEYWNLLEWRTLLSSIRQTALIISGGTKYRNCNILQYFLLWYNIDTVIKTMLEMDSLAATLTYQSDFISVTRGGASPEVTFTQFICKCLRP